MSNMSYEEPRMEMPEPHLIPDEKQYRDDRYRGRDDTEDFDSAMDEHAPMIQDTLQNRDSLIRGIINGTAQPSGSNRKRTSRKGGSHSTSASMSSANTPTPRAPASQSSATSSHNGHARHASTSAINGTTNGTPTADEISKLISRLATERQKTANLQDSLTRAHADANFHAKRLDDAESRMSEQRKREAENTKRRKAMEIEVSKMREQLRFVKVQYEGAVEEIRKAQDVINSLEEERGRAVQEANREREKVRVLEEERKLKEAREAGYEEGRRLGMEEGAKRGAAEGKRYGVKDGREAERERQKKAMRELVEDDEVYEPRPPREQQQQQQRQEYSEPREIYNRVGDETPGLSRSRSLNVNPIIAPVVTVDPQTHTANVLGLPLLETGNPSAAGYPSTAPANLSRHPSAPVGNREQQTHRGYGAPNYSSVFPRDNPNVNILSGFEDEPVRAMGMAAPELSMEASLGKRDNRTSAPPRINTSSIDRDRDRSDPSQQRSWGGGIIGNGQGYRAPIRQRSGSGGTTGTTGTGINGLSRNTGRGSVTPPSASTQDRSTPLDQYGILGDGGSYGGGLMSQVAEMTPIMEAGSEPGPTPTQAYFQDAAMGVRPPQEEVDRRERERRAQEQREAEERVRYEQDRFKQQQQQNQRWEPPPQPPQESRYVPPQRRTPQPSPTNPTGPGGPNDWRRKSPQPSSASNSSTLVNGSVRGPQRKPVPGLGATAANGRPRGNSINAPRGHGRAASADMYGSAPAPATRPGTGAAGGHSLPPIEIFPGTPPDQANARSTKMAQAGSSLMGSPAFVASDIGYGADPGAASSRGAGGSQMNGGGGHGHGHGHGHGGGGRGHGGRTDYGPHGTPLASPQPMRSPLLTGGELRNEYVQNDPTGGPYRPNSRQQQNGNTRQGQGQGPAGSAHRRGALSMGGVGDHGRHQQPPASPSRFTAELHNPPHQTQPPPPSSPSRFNSTSLAQPTPRHAANALDMSPEEITIHPSGTTPISTGRFDAGGQYTGVPTNTSSAKGKGKAKPSAQVKQMRRQGYVDYDDEVPEDLTMGYSVRDQDPPMTTRSRVQSMYGISDHNGPKRTPQYESAPLPKKTPAYEDAPLPLPKSARMMPGGLPQHQAGGYTLGQEGRSVFGHGQPMPSPAKSQTSSQARRAMEDDLDTPIGPYDEQDHDQNRFSTIDILDEKAELWEPRSGTFPERKLPRGYSHDGVEIVPPPNASPQNRPVHHQDTSFLGTATHAPPPASPGVGVRGPPNAYVDTRNFDDSSLGPIRSNEPNSFMVDRSGNPVRTPMRQSMPITASARSSTSAMPLPPVQPTDIPWATGKTTTSQLPRPDTMYESAPPSATTVPPTSTTWGYVRESGQSLAPLGPLSNGGLSFSVGGGMANQTAMYNLANTSPVSTGRAQPIPLPTFHQNQIPPPGSTRSNIMQIPGTARSGVMGLPPPGSTRFNIMDVAPPGTGRSAVQPLPSQSQIMLAGMLSSRGPGPEIDEDPIIPSGGGPVGGGKKKKAGGKKKK